MLLYFHMHGGNYTGFLASFDQGAPTGVVAKLVDPFLLTGSAALYSPMPVHELLRCVEEVLLCVSADTHPENTLKRSGLRYTR